MIKEGKKIESYNPIFRLSESYEFLCEILNNPIKAGYIKLIKKIKSGNMPPLNLELLDFKIKIDKEILELSRRILRKVNIE